MIDKDFFRYKPVIGVIHLPPLPGSPGYTGIDVNYVVEKALEDAANYVENNVDAVIIENYGDIPFNVRVTEPNTLASIAIISWEIRKKYRIPLGINILRNSGVEAAAIACTVGLDFLRINSLVEHVLTPEGVLSPIARELSKKLAEMNCRVSILADVNVKHGVSLFPLEIAIKETEERGNADALIVTGERTGAPPAPATVYYVKKIARRYVIVGSGINLDNIRLYYRIADGFIIGTYFKKDGVTTNPVDPSRVRKFMNIINELRREMK